MISYKFLILVRIDQTKDILYCVFYYVILYVLFYNINNNSFSLTIYSNCFILIELFGLKFREMHNREDV